MKKITFYKIVASGNDFIVIDGKKERLSDKKIKLTMLARDICQRKTGVGSDGLLFIKKGRGNDAYMRIFNSDGSEAEMCGNGARAAAVYLSSISRSKKKELKFNTIAGEILAKVDKDTAKIKMTHPKDINFDVSLDIEPRPVKVDYVDTGVPHSIVFVEGIDAIDVRGIGRAIRYHRKFSPRGTNVDFVEVLKDDTIKVRTYERGVEGETLACGTGAVASSIITFLKFFNDKQRKTGLKMNAITLSTDVLSVYFDYKDDKITNLWLKGKANIIYKGEYYV